MHATVQGSIGEGRTNKIGGGREGGRRGKGIGRDCTINQSTVSINYFGQLFILPCKLEHCIHMVSTCQDPDRQIRIFG